MTQTTSTQDGPFFDEELWELVWERRLSQVERHAIAMAVARRRKPREPMEQRIAAELARQWRRRAVTLAVGYALWAVFWGAIAWSDWRADGTLWSALCPVNSAIGVLAVAACFAFRYRLRDLPRGWSPH